MFKSAMYRTLLICLCISVALAARADYRIVKMNTPAIAVGGRTLHVNDIFSPSAPIRWTDDRQAIVVADTDSGTRMLVVAEQFRAADASTMAQYIATLPESGEKPDLEELKSALAGRHYLLDTLAIETSVPTDSRHFFFISYPFTNHEISKWVDNNNGTFTLHTGLFPSGGQQDNAEMHLKIYFCDRTTGAVTPVCDRMTVIVLPKQL